MTSSRRRARWRVAAAITALMLTASACSSADNGENLSPAAEPAATTATTETPQEPEAALADPSATTQPAATTTEAPAVTTTAAPEPAPHITIWSAPRLHETTLSASWQVTPDDATCNWELLDADGEIVGTGVADTADGDPSRRAMSADYDLQSTDTLGAVTIRCARLGSDQAVVEHPVHRVTYKNRSPDSVIPATDEYYFDHDEVAALFPRCRPARIWSWRRSTEVADAVTVPYTTQLAEYIDDDLVLYFVGPERILPLSSEYDVAVWPSQDGSGSRYVDERVGMDAGLNFWTAVFENWDTETQEVFGQQTASGWWTTHQLRMMFPQSNVITATSVRQRLRDWSRLVYGQGGRALVTLNHFWDRYPEKYRVIHLAQGEYPEKRHGFRQRNLYLRLNAAVGYLEDTTDVAADDWRRRSFGELGQWIRDDGIAGDGKPNPPGVEAKDLLWDWVDARYRFPPIDKEPTAWAMRTLLLARAYDCVAEQMRRHCESGEFHSSPHMRHPSHGGSRLGSVLWSAVCPEVTP